MAAAFRSLPTTLIKAAVKILAGALTSKKTAEPKPAVDAENPKLLRMVGNQATVV